MPIAVVNGLDLLFIGIGLLILAWIVWTYDPDKAHEARVEHKRQKARRGYEVIIRCANAEDQAEVFYYLSGEVESGRDGMPHDIEVHMPGNPRLAPSFKREEQMSICDADEEALRAAQCRDDEIAVHLEMHAEGLCPLNSDEQRNEYVERVEACRRDEREDTEECTALREKAMALVTEWDGYQQGYAEDGEMVMCVCGHPFPQRMHHECPYDATDADVEEELEVGVDDA